MAPDASSRKGESSSKEDIDPHPDPRAAPAAAKQPPRTKKMKLATSVESSRSGTPAVNGDGSHSATKPPTSLTSFNADGIEVQQCKHCKKTHPKDGFPNHSKQCLREKKLKKKMKEEQAAKAQAELDKAAEKPDAEGDVVDETILVKSPIVNQPPTTAQRGEDMSAASTTFAKPAAKKVDASGPDDETANAKKTKKRKADDTPIAGDGPSRPPTKKQKKKEDASKPKPVKPKGPVDVEKQCGVLMENGNLCARSLTCKSHAMGAKRAVPGRSAPYDVLLTQYQKRNQAKQQKDKIASNAPLLDDFDDQAGTVDSDEEKDAIMAAFQRRNPRPIFSRPMVSVQSRYNNIRIKEMLHNALGGNRGSGLFTLKRDHNDDDDNTPLSQSARTMTFGQQQQHFRNGSVGGGI